MRFFKFLLSLAVCSSPAVAQPLEIDTSESLKWLTGTFEVNPGMVQSSTTNDGSQREYLFMDIGNVRVAFGTDQDSGEYRCFVQLVDLTSPEQAKNYFDVGCDGVADSYSLKLSSGALMPSSINDVRQSEYERLVEFYASNLAQFVITGNQQLIQKNISECRQLESSVREVRANADLILISRIAEAHGLNQDLWFKVYGARYTFESRIRLLSQDDRPVILDVFDSTGGYRSIDTDGDGFVDEMKRLTRTERLTLETPVSLTLDKTTYACIGMFHINLMAALGENLEWFDK